ncbi:accessory gene regulator ArgB-like protein [Brevibacillus porteri]|uniref:Accessory regulator AgrB n=1 Tax=Brevibacillus porteri TaxID=2126350 RepID=A0ABX5FTR7_9BACL|nr:accessory gene regulator B family protein [Brevibacillus porteri]MED1800640.1 accessory gene regulator B family protein [Brevibacillus porteri]MED2134732.1 accessory gene regulator B family protein [Brevibacillus porteri]MED2745611.1 accessory gene regulator B family protein [Brevibacillus porteri]MED2814751.1 accessory gene regulator B family protein [Brevibacillus porteri]MED2896325.1 accessory gene regulator B family protein [Brevibacillus porteri]
MIESLAEKIAIAMKSVNSDQTASIPTLKFGLIIVINGFLIVLVSMVLGSLTGKAMETAVTIIAFVVLRLTSGGIHLHSSTACTVVSIGTMSVLPHIAISDKVNVILLVVAALLVLIFAPSRIEGHSNIDKKYYPTLKWISIAIVSINFFLLSPTVSKAFFVQAMSLIHIRRQSK